MLQVILSKEKEKRNKSIVLYELLKSIEVVLL
jgi:hypothetical protein